MSGYLVRQVTADEWPQVKALRIEALEDPAAAMAFYGTASTARRQPDAFWQRRAADASTGEGSAQFVAIASDRWVGTATVLVRDAGTTDHTGRIVLVTRADVVGVFVSESARGSGVLGALFDAAAEWVSERGIDALTLDVHTDNARARAAYRREGFTDTGVTFTTEIGPEREMRRPLTTTRDDRAAGER